MQLIFDIYDEEEKQQSLQRQNLTANTSECPPNGATTASENTPMAAKTHMKRLF